MISRLLLVGMVSVLGISLPDGAEWGMVLTWARTGTTACARGREAVAFEPIAVDENPINRIADELNRRSEGLDISAAPIVKAVTIPRHVATASDRAVESLFTENRVWSQPAAADIASSLPVAATRRPAFEPIAVTDGASSLADALNRASEGLDIDLAAVAVRAPRRPIFEPIAVAEAPSNVGDELNRASEGLTTTRDEEPNIGTALRLTHEAALAWMNVLTKTVTTSGHSR
jgi:hypothetical protein